MFRILFCWEGAGFWFGVKGIRASGYVVVLWMLLLLPPELLLADFCARETAWTETSAPFPYPDNP